MALRRVLVDGTNTTVDTSVDGEVAIDAAGGGGGGGASDLDDLTDVTLTAPSTGQVLKFNGSVWVNAVSYTHLTLPTNREV